MVRANKFRDLNDEKRKLIASVIQLKMLWSPLRSSLVVSSAGVASVVCLRVAGCVPAKVGFPVTCIS